MAIEKIQILGAVLELPAKKRCQSSPFTSKIGPNGLNWQCYLAGSSKMAPRILIFSIAIDVDYLYEVKNSEIQAPAFFKHNSFIATVYRIMHLDSFIINWLKFSFSLQYVIGKNYFPTTLIFSTKTLPTYIQNIYLEKIYYNVLQNQKSMIHSSTILIYVFFYLVLLSHFSEFLEHLDMCFLLYNQ